MASWLQYINFLLRERKGIEQKLDKMSKAEMIAFGRQLLGACQQSLRGFDAWFTDYSIMEKMDIEMIRNISRNLLRIGFGLLEYDRDVTKIWHEKELNEMQKRIESKAKKRRSDHLV